MANRLIVWDKLALKQFNRAILHIAEDSIKNAENVRADILIKIEDIPAQPQMYPSDKYKTDNDGNYRAFELHHLRIAYRILPDSIQILRIRHASREPSKY